MKKLRKTAELIMVAATWLWPPRLTGSEWADAHRVLPSADAEPGPYRTDRFPLVREIQDVLADDDTREIVIWGPTQSAKTTVMCNFVGRIIHHDPGRTLVVYPTEDKAKEFSIEKLEPMLVSCPALADKAAIGTARTMRKSILDKSFPGMSLLIRGGNNENPFSSGSMKNVFLDEVDRIPRNKEGRPIDLARQRCSTFATYKLVMGSTCTDAGNSEIESEYEKSDQRKPYVPCLSCGHMHIMGFFAEGMTYHEPGTGYVDFDDAQDAEAAKAAARYRCPECKYEHFDKDKPAMLARLEWRKHNPSSKTAGFWWSALYSPWVSFGQLAYEFRASKDDDDSFRVFWNCRLARTWKVKTDAPSISVLDACVDKERPRGQVPSEALILTGGADVQKHVVYWVVRAWGANGRSWLINNGVTERDDGALGWLDEVFAAPYDGHSVRMAFIDSGWDEEIVYDHCLARRNCFPSKGVGNNPEWDVKDSDQTREKGQFRSRGFTLWLVNSSKLRGTIHDRIALPADSPRAWRLHSDVDTEYKNQILNREREETKKQGKFVTQWVEDKKNKPDHYLDAEIYALAAAKCKFMAPLLVAGRLPPAPVASQRPKDDPWAIRPLGRI